MKKSPIIWAIAVLAVVLIVWFVLMPRTALAPQTSATNNGSSKSSTSSVAPKIVSVSISNLTFSPGTLTITKGTTVTWTNKDSMIHTVTSFPGGPNSGNLSRGGTYSFTFTKVGTFNYHCSIHPGMLGTVYVSE